MINSNAPDILKEIVEVKKERLDVRKKELSIESLERLISDRKRPLNFSGCLMGESVRVIAEVKRGSPSKGIFSKDIKAAELAKVYAENGAAAVSVLTNEDFFYGSIDDLLAGHNAIYELGVPVLRKEFIFDPYQIYEARAYGADAILLIVSMLDKSQLVDFKNIATSLWMQCLVEVHDEKELELALESDAEIIGINNRDLRTFNTTLETTEILGPQVPNGRILVSESGISSRADVERVLEAGAGAVLIGESLVTSDDPGIALRNLL
ncbi:MAG: indole-3-glycerol phosphate synthase TrpC [Dehalococcoidia bacterium]|tara:strand:+ start:12480 stop:13277 length:798 start_codon:yes stop_codon:yes gene_type:complete